MDELNLVNQSSAVDHTIQGQSQEQPPRLRRSGKRRKKGWRIFFVVLGVVFLALLTTTLIGVSRFIGGVQQTEAAIESAQEAAADFDFQGAEEALHEAKYGLESAKSGLVFIRWMYVLPWVGDQVEAVTAVVDAGLQAVLALEEVIGLAEEVYTIVLEAQEVLSETTLPEDGPISFDDFSQEVKADLLRTLSNSHGDLLEMQVKLTLAQKNLDKLDELNASPMITDAVAPFEELLPDLIAGVDFLVPFAATVGELAGVDQDRQWLMLFLNNTEMRPGGGFIGVYGLLLARDGEIVNMNVDDSYAVDVLVQFDETYQLPPPQPLAQYVGVDKWYFRDANWSPDFPTASRDSIQLLRQEIAHTGQPAPEVHGVIGFTTTFAEAIVALTGPITVRGETFTSENLTQRLEELVEYEFEDIGSEYEERKAIVGELTDAVLNELFSMPVDQWGDLFDTFLTAFSEKHIALYSTDEQTQAAFVSSGWAGQVDTKSVDDILMIVDANMAALKTDAVVDRDITYSIVPVGDDFHATVEIEYTNTGAFTLFTSRYRTYTRVYAPLGSELVSHSGSLLNDKLSNPDLLEGDVTVADDLGMTSFGAFTSVEPGESRTLSFTYKLPQSVEDAINGKLYQLRVVKQVGAADHKLTLQLDFGKKVKAATPSEDESHYGDDAYTVNTNIDQDKVFTVQF